LISREEEDKLKKSLHFLLKAVDVLETRGVLPDLVTRVTYDSRQAERETLFVALRGEHVDGHDFLESATESGAACAIVEEFREEASLPQVRVASTTVALAQISAAYYDHPADSMTMIGITGSNGKTSTAYMIESILMAAGKKVGVVGTIEHRWEGVVRKGSNTTPLALELQSMLAEMKKAGVEVVVMEVSSHALSLDRVFGIRFQEAVFTNFTQDHLDFHKTMDEYQKAKEKLFFEHLDLDAPGIINLDDPVGESISSRVPGRGVGYGIDSEDAKFNAANIKMNRDGLSFILRLSDGSSVPIRSPLTGRHNVYNLLAAAGAAFALRVDVDSIKKGLESLRAVPGRLEEIPNDRGVKIYVDYAHTEDALRQALKTLDMLPHRKIITVFGAGGDRDKTKRPLMGAAALEYSDWVVLTSDNPRSEDPRTIISDIEKGLEKGKDRYEVVVDRAEAIRAAIRKAEQDDIVLIAGKGHEATQTFADKVIDFDDRKNAADALKELE